MQYVSFSILIKLGIIILKNWTHLKKWLSNVGEVDNCKYTTSSNPTIAMAKDKGMGIWHYS
jgi:hypothetical protein